MCAYTYTCVPIRMNMYLYVCICADTYTYVPIRLHMCPYVTLCVPKRTHMYPNVHICTNMYQQLVSENESHFPYSASLTLKRTPYVYTIMMYNGGKDGAAKSMRKGRARRYPLRGQHVA
jgi:hypothetical protein